MNDSYENPQDDMIKVRLEKIVVIESFKKRFKRGIILTQLIWRT